MYCPGKQLHFAQECKKERCFAATDRATDDAELVQRKLDRKAAQTEALLSCEADSCIMQSQCRFCELPWPADVLCAMSFFAREIDFDATQA